MSDSPHPELNDFSGTITVLICRHRCLLKRPSLKIKVECDCGIVAWFLMASVNDPLMNFQCCKCANEVPLSWFRSHINLEYLRWKQQQKRKDELS